MSGKQKRVELIVTVRDVTQQVLLANKLREEENRREKLLQLMLSILDVEPQMLNDFRDSTNRELSFIDEIMNQSKIDDYQELLKKIFRSAHLIKGNAKLLNIDYFADQTHMLEDIISEIQEKSEIADDDIQPLRDKLKELQSGMEEMQKIIERIGQVLSHGSKKKSDAKLLLTSLENLINSFSSDLGKKIKFSYKNFKNSIIPVRYHLLVKEILIQLVRNSISHGIEEPDERLRLKKPKTGIIELSTHKHNGTICVRLKDDGRGLQINKLKQRAKESGKWSDHEINSWSDQQAAKIIFESGISTSENVNMVAGRGVGMDSVRHRIEEYDGKININFAENKFCEFEIILPQVA